jgi:hypothetical protein
MSCLQVFTSDHALKLDWIPKWIAIIGSGYIGLEFSDVYTALGSEVTFIEVRHRNLHCAEHIRHLHFSQIKLLSQFSSIRHCHVTVLHPLIMAACARYVRITSTFLNINNETSVLIHAYGSSISSSGMHTLQCSKPSTACCLACQA